LLVFQHGYLFIARGQCEAAGASAVDSRICGCGISGLPQGKRVEQQLALQEGSPALNTTTA